MISTFFIDRPVFANVIAVLTVLFGVVALGRLPIEQYPQITPPTVQVTTVYPGANAEVLADTVAAPIEQQVNGVENMLYMSSTCSSDGSYTLTVTFAIGTNLDMAQVLVQNRVAQAQAQLPDEVRRQGVITQKQSTSILLVVALTSPEGTYNDLFLSNYATISIRDALSRIKGVGSVRVVGAANYGMRLWLDPHKLRIRGLTTQDIVNALNEQNVQVAAGQLGAPPAPAGQNFQYTITTLGRLSSAQQFADIIVKTGEEGQITRVKDIGRVELGAQTYDQYSFVGRTVTDSQGEETKVPVAAASVVTYLLPGANAVEVAEKIKAAMKRLERYFPEDVEYNIPFDTTLFVEASIHEVYKTLYEAGVLVLVVILVFLQDWRAVLVPATTVPVTIVGAFACMLPLGFTVNTLTLFGLILAIGIVVDDAIVIVENAAHHLEHGGVSPRDATIQAMREVTGPVIGVTLVLMAVFLPTAFLPGITGQLYRQFALTIAATALISAINALTLKPVQCATYLKPPSGKKSWFSRGFDAVYGPIEAAYAGMVWLLIKLRYPALLLFAGLVVVTGWWYTQLPTGFLPTEDQGYVVTLIQLPDAASQERTRAVVDQVQDVLGKTPGIKTWLVLGSNSVIDGSIASNAAAVYVIFDPWEERMTPEKSMPGILAHLQKEFFKIDAIVFSFPPPAIQGLGVAGGFQMQLQDRGNIGLDELQTYTRVVMKEAREKQGIGPTTSTFRAAVPQLYLDVDRTRAKMRDVDLKSVFNTLQSYLGSAYVNDFNKFGRTWQVRIQADKEYRSQEDDIRRLEVRNRQGKMVPLGAVLDVRQSYGPQVIVRYNLFPSAAINGSAAPGYSSGEALRIMEEIAEGLPKTMGFEWTGMAYQERAVGGQEAMIFALAVLLVYLVLAAQYESWILPVAVILVVPLGLLGAVAAVASRGLDNNVYTQIGVVLIIALASKNAILIVEFARDLHNQGVSITEAALRSARLRFRPILMTSFAFILGVLPLVIATGAGAASRQALGTAVFGGMIASTILAVFFVPIFFVVVQGFLELVGGRRSAVAIGPPASAPPAPIPTEGERSGGPGTLREVEAQQSPHGITQSPKPTPPTGDGKP